MKKEKKKAIRESLESAIAQALSVNQIQDPSKKTKRVIAKASKVILREVKRVLDKRVRKTVREAKSTTKNSKTSKKPVGQPMEV